MKKYTRPTNDFVDSIDLLRDKLTLKFSGMSGVWKAQIPWELAKFIEVQTTKNTGIFKNIRTILGNQLYNDKWKEII